MSPRQDDRTPGAHILLVEDEESLAVGLEYNLNEEGYSVSWARDGKQALQLLEAGEFDLVILDIMIPYIDGFEVAQKIREKSQQLPILILTARKGAQDRIRGLRLGADDYLTKPFELEELLLRVQRMLIRKQWYQEIQQTDTYRLGDFEINFSDLTARSPRKEIQLTLREAMVLKYLIEHRGKIVSREELLENVWQMDAGMETRTVDNFIVRLRKYFEPDPAHPVYIKSVRGAGYIFDEKPSVR